MKKNENPHETLRAGFFIYLFIFLFFYGKDWDEFGYIVFRLSGSQ